ncbi:pre-mRNA-splicing factor CWC2 [Phanerochaete sordida]|uniref:Pre-mRNA-splicing factor CWC2 n=1 Tax=Phanerochaete sordida TaxID=48140 RepID=A0A9P3LDI4_9APHY|nr:pre-mRNA-splicing factor CWC2 [Phanerochaete sordida]
MSSTTQAEIQVVPGKKAKKLKPARKQVKPGEVEKKEAPQTGKEYNIWYNKWAGGDREDSYSNKVKSQTRCNIKRDSGMTRANTTGVKYCCLFFARGCCPYGWECEYLHTLPDPSQSVPDTSKDCFARDKFADYRDDMGGVGSFQRQNRTLYVGRIKETGTGPETEEVVRRHFKEWGEIEKIRVLQYRSVAFVTYVHEGHAQFAKEAMACQSLDNDEILNVRWATEDPNPTSKVEERERLEAMGREAIQAKMDPRIIDAVRAVRALEEGVELDDEPEIEEDEDAPPTKRRKLELEDAESTPELPEEPPQPKGLLSADTLESLKYFTEIRQRSGAANGAAKVAPKPPPPTGLGLGGYGSDEDD